MNLGNVNFGEDFNTYDMKLSLLTMSDEWLVDISKNFIDSMELKLTETSSITLTIPYYIVRDGKRVKYESYDLFADNRIISLNESHKFIIRNIEVLEGINDHYKKFTAFSLESTLQRIPAIMEDATRQLRKDSVNLASGYLDLFKEQCYGWDWTCSESAYIEHVNGGTSNKYRWLSVGDSNFLEATRQTVADAFNIIPIFDSYNRILHIVTEEELENHSGLFLDFGNYLKSTSKNTSRDKSCTQLRVVSDKTSISSVNLNGSEIIEYYSDEIRDKMSFELRNALANYDVIANEQNLIFVTKKLELVDIEREISNKTIELIKLEEEYNVLVIKRKQYITDNNNDGLSSIFNSIESVSNRVNVKKSEIENLHTRKANIEKIMQEIAVKLNKETCTNNNNQKIFNPQTLSELFLFTQSDTYQNDTALTPYALLNDATTELKKRQEGIVEFTIEELTSNFIFGVKRKDGRKWNEVMELGSLITVTTKENGEKDLRLVGYTVTPTSNEKGTPPQLKLVLSDRTFIWNDVRFNTSSKKSQNASNGIFNGKTKWDNYREGVDTANSIRMNGLELATARVTGRTNNNAVTLDGYGMMFENTDTKVDQLYIGSNLLCFSDDGWKTSKTALDKHGLIASTIAGELLIGERLIIQNENNFFKIDKDGAFFKGNNLLIEGSDGGKSSINAKFQVTNDTISAVVGKVDSQGNRIDSAEQKITSTAIINSINTAINNGSAGIDTVSTILNKDGFTVKNGAFTLLDENGNQVLKGNKNGTLTLGNGALSTNNAKLTKTDLTFENSQGKTMSMKNGRFNLFKPSWEYNQNLYLGSLMTTKLANHDQHGISLFGSSPCYYMDFGVDYNAHNENQGYYYTPLLRLAFAENIENTPKGVHTYARTFIHDKLEMLGYPIRLHKTKHDTIFANDNGLFIGGAGVLSLGLVNGEGAVFPDLKIQELGFSKRLTSNIWFDMQGNQIYNTNITRSYSTANSRTRSASYKETSSIEGNNKQIRLPLTGQIKNGSCRINIPYEFLECMSKYIVTGLTKYGKGDIYISEEFEEYFIVECDTDVKFTLDLIILKNDMTDNKGNKTTIPYFKN